MRSKDSQICISNYSGRKAPSLKNIFRCRRSFGSTSCMVHDYTVRGRCPTVKSSNTLTRTSTIKLKYRVLSLFVFAVNDLLLP